MTKNTLMPSAAPRSGSLDILIYLRVSTGRQAEVDLSIPDQRRQIEAWAAARGHRIVGHYTEAGASATDDKRPEFQAMIGRYYTCQTRQGGLAYAE